MATGKRTSTPSFRAEKRKTARDAGSSNLPVLVVDHDDVSLWCDTEPLSLLLRSLYTVAADSGWMAFANASGYIVFDEAPDSEDGRHEELACRDPALIPPMTAAGFQLDELENDGSAVEASEKDILAAAAPSMPAAEPASPAPALAPNRTSHTPVLPFFRQIQDNIFAFVTQAPAPDAAASNALALKLYRIEGTEEDLNVLRFKNSLLRHEKVRTRMPLRQVVWMGSSRKWGAVCYHEVSDKHLVPLQYHLVMVDPTSGERGTQTLHVLASDMRNAKVVLGILHPPTTSMSRTATLHTKHGATDVELPFFRIDAIHAIAPPSPIRRVILETDTHYWVSHVPVQQEDFFFNNPTHPLAPYTLQPRNDAASEMVVVEKLSTGSLHIGAPFHRVAADAILSATQRLGAALWQCGVRFRAQQPFDFEPAMNESIAQDQLKLRHTLRSATPDDPVTIATVRVDKPVVVYIASMFTAAEITMIVLDGVRILSRNNLCSHPFVVNRFLEVHISKLFVGDGLRSYSPVQACKLPQDVMYAPLDDTTDAFVVKTLPRIQLDDDTVFSAETRPREQLLTCKGKAPQVVCNLPVRFGITKSYLLRETEALMAPPVCVAWRDVKFPLELRVVQSSAELEFLRSEWVAICELHGPVATPIYGAVHLDAGAGDLRIVYARRKERRDGDERLDALDVLVRLTQAIV